MARRSSTVGGSHVRPDDDRELSLNLGRPPSEPSERPTATCDELTRLSATRGFGALLTLLSNGRVVFTMGKPKKSRSEAILTSDPSATQASAPYQTRRTPARPSHSTGGLEELQAGTASNAVFRLTEKNPSNVRRLPIHRSAPKVAPSTTIPRSPPYACRLYRFRCGNTRSVPEQTRSVRGGPSWNVLKRDQRVIGLWDSDGIRLEFHRGLDCSSR